MYVRTKQDKQPCVSVLLSVLTLSFLAVYTQSDALRTVSSVIAV